MKDFVYELKENLIYILKWFLLSLLIGTLCGLVGTAFHICINYVTNLRNTYEFIFYFLIIGGLIIIFLYRRFGLYTDPGTNVVIESVRMNEVVPPVLAPAVFLSTVITHLVGGSSGREGAALQIGGSISTYISYLLGLKDEDHVILIMAGMSAVFSALFGTPITATIFSMEVISVGVIYYAALLPCLFSSLIAFYISQSLGCSATKYILNEVLKLDPIIIGKVICIAIIVAIISIEFVSLMHYSTHIFHTKFNNAYFRISIGSIIIYLLVILFGKRYLGAGMNIVEDALYSHVYWYDFILKAIFTAVTIGCGFKGGEIVPTFVIGASLGYILGILFNVNPHIIAAISLVGMFCCVVNCPITSLLLSVEVFGINYLIPMSIVISICYLMSGYFSLYQSQKIIYYKTKPKLLNKNAK